MPPVTGFTKDVVSPLDNLDAALAARRAKGLYRQRLVLDSPQGVHVRIGSEELISFCSNDYLGLANHPDVIAAMQRGAERYGVGAGASHLVTGHSSVHEALEEELADFLQCERALLFSTGYMANLGVVAALAGRDGHIYEDRLNHASLIDGARLARCAAERYPHGDVTALDEMLVRDRPAKPIITTDGVFSMDGDIAPLPELVSLAGRSGAFLVVDDAHGIGVLGDAGRGCIEHWGLRPRYPIVLVGTLGKAFGTFGAFVSGESSLVEALIQGARTYIYTTALPPPLAEATRASLQLVRTEGWRRERLQVLTQRFRRGTAQLGVTTLPSRTPIQGLLVGDAAKAVAVSQALRRAGFLIPAIRPPTVPDGSARLRITFSSLHNEAHVDRLLDALSHIAMLRETPVNG